MAVPKTVAQVTPPKKPSQVRLGLIAGVMTCLPNSFSQVY